MIEATTGTGLTGVVNDSFEEEKLTKPNSPIPDGDRSSIFQQPIGRRALLKGAGALGVATLAAPWLSAAEALASTGRRRERIPIRHVVVDMQENRSFDHY